MIIRKILPFVLQHSVWIPTRTFFSFFCRLNVQGLENLKYVESPAIFASNHVSEFDPILIPASLPFFSRFLPFFYVARQSYLDSIRGIRKYIYGGPFFKAWGAYPTHSGQKNYETSLQEHATILESGGNMCIFPEGKISLDGKLGEIHGGVAYLADTREVPVIPVTISGAFGLTLRNIFDRKQQITVTFEKPIFPDEIAGAKGEEPRMFYPRVAQKIMGKHKNQC